MPKSSSHKQSKSPGKKGKAHTQRNDRPIQTIAVPSSFSTAVVDPLPWKITGSSTTRACTFVPAVLQANTGDTLRGFYVTLSLIPNGSLLAQVFNKWTVRSMEFEFIPFATQSTPAAGNFPGIIGTWTDTDDANLPANMAEGQRFDSFQINPATEIVRRVVRPKPAIAAYSGSFTSYTTLPGEVWADCDSPNVQFYGLKACISGSKYASPTDVYTVYCRVVFTFKDDR